MWLESRLLEEIRDGRKESNIIDVSLSMLSYCFMRM